jgi:hypothetical protein
MDEAQPCSGRVYIGPNETRFTQVDYIPAGGWALSGGVSINGCSDIQIQSVATLTIK